MDTSRQQKVNRLLQKELGDIFRLNMQQYLPGVMVTVTFVRITSDLSLARINLSFFPTPKREALLNVVKKRSAEVRMLLAARVKNQLRIIPHLQFFIDDTLDRVERLDELLKS